MCLPIHSVASDYGTTGLIDTPTARMGEDGDFTTTLSYDNYSASSAITYQAFPWLEASYRYSGIDVYTPGSYDNRYFDRNYGVKLLLNKESEYLPEMAVGIRDMVGTGVYGSEYLVGSKRFGNLDLSLGLGWGRLAGSGDVSNPLKFLGSSIKTRTQDVGQGGNLSSKTFFRGDKAGFFGGIQYDLDSVPVTLKLEHNPDNYDWEVARGQSRPSSSLSYGLDWEINDSHSLSFSHQHGDEIGFNYRLKLGSKDKPNKKSIAPIKRELIPSINTKPSQEAQVMDQLLSKGIDVMAIEIKKHKAQVKLRRGAYQFWPYVIIDAHDVLSQELTDEISVIEYLIHEKGFDLHTIRVPRYSGENYFNEDSFINQIKILKSRSLSQHALKANDVFESEPKFNIGVDSNLHLFDPNNPLGIQTYVELDAQVPITERLSLKGSYQVDVYDNLDKNVRVSDSVLPHVRSDSAKYLKQSNGSRLDHLIADYRDTLSEGLHLRLYGGVLEKMYSGMGGEILFNPNRSRFGLGISAARVKQRDYKGGLDHLDYETTTGHASLYWATPFDNYDAALHVGRYLAKDSGGTVEVRRTFNNNWMVGLWATKTDVSAQDFGEGSFDKGIYLKIPIDFGLTNDQDITLKLRPILRDGGARLEGYSGQLWWDLRPGRFDVFSEGE